MIATLHIVKDSSDKPHALKRHEVHLNVEDSRNTQVLRGVLYTSEHIDGIRRTAGLLILAAVYGDEAGNPEDVVWQHVRETDEYVTFEAVFPG